MVQSWFAYCSVLSNVNIINAKAIAQEAFKSCSALSQLTLNSCSSIGAYAFSDCISLELLYLLSSSRVYVGAASTAFTNTPMMDSTILGYYGSIYIPSSLYSQYTTSNAWSAVWDRFVSYP